jgi:hypothetical protein
MKAVLARCEGSSGQGNWERGVCAAHRASPAADGVTPAPAAMPPLVELSSQSRSECFRELDSLHFSMDGLYAT